MRKWAGVVEGRTGEVGRVDKPVRYIGSHHILTFALLRLRLSGERRVVNNEVVGTLEDAKIGRDQIATLNEANVTRYQLGRDNLISLAITHQLHLGRKHPREGSHEVLGLGVLHVREDTSHHHHRHENDAEVKVILGAFDTIPNETENGSRPKEEGEEASELKRASEANRG